VLIVCCLQGEGLPCQAAEAVTGHAGTAVFQQAVARGILGETVFRLGVRMVVGQLSM